MNLHANFGLGIAQIGELDKEFAISKAIKEELFVEEDKQDEYLDQSSATVLNTTLPLVKEKVMEQDELRVYQVQWLAKSSAATTLSVPDGFGTLLNMKETQMFAG